VKLLLDTCVWGGARHELEQAGHEAIWAGEWPEDPGDEEILARAHSGGRTLVTLDKDYGELSVVRHMPHSGIVRLAGIAARRQAQACLYALRHYGAELQRGAIVTVEPGRLRIRPPEAL